MTLSAKSRAKSYSNNMTKGDLIRAPGQLRPGRLRTVGDVRAELAQIYRDARVGRLETPVATRLTYLLAVLQKAIEAETLESRIVELEKRLPKRTHRARRVTCAIVFGIPA